MIVQRFFGLTTLFLLVVQSLACVEYEGVIAPIDELHYPVGIEIHPNGRYLYVVNSNFDVSFRHDRGGTIAIVDTDTLELIPEGTMSIGSFGGRAVLSPDASHLYVAVRGDNSIYRLLVEPGGRILSCEDSRNGLPCRISGLSSDPVALAVSEHLFDLEVGGVTPVEMIVTTSLQSNNVTAISIKDDDVSTVRRLSADLLSGSDALAVHPRTGYYYAAGRFSDYVRAFLPVIGREGDVAALYGLDQIDLPNPIGTYDCRDIVFSASGDRAYVAARNPDGILILDTSPQNRETGSGTRNVVIDQIDLDESPAALALVEEESGDYLYVSEFGGDSVAVIDTATHRVVDRFHVGDGPSHLAVDQHRYQRIYVTLFNEAAVAVIDIDPESPRYHTAVAKIR